MKIKIYIVTYKNEEDLNKNLESLFKSDIINYNYEINIINNHSKFNIEKKFQDKVSILHNNLRPDFSTGHLARNWNQAIINGFKDLNKPDCDILIHCQDDVIFKKDWTNQLIEFHKKYTFITMGTGDAFCSYLPEAVKKIGLWDERFCSLTHHDADYFMRAIKYNGPKSSINDIQHNRIYNQIGVNTVGKYVDKPAKIENKEVRGESPLIIIPSFTEERFDSRSASMRHGKLTNSVIKKKWGKWATGRNWWKKYIFLINLNSPAESYIQYPFFENNVETLNQQNYILENHFQNLSYRTKILRILNHKSFIKRVLAYMLRYYKNVKK